jgi:hypothetical protein
MSQTTRLEFGRREIVATNLALSGERVFKPWIVANAHFVMIAGACWF